MAGAGSNDGTGSTARFRAPYALTVDGSGNVYVADSGNNLIRKITSAGVVTTIAGNLQRFAGSTDGTGTAAYFAAPAGITVDGTGAVYVADTTNNTIRKITPAGVVTTLSGSASLSGTANGTGTAARFHSPNGVAVDSSGNVFVADSSNSTIRKVTPAGVVTTFAGSPQQTGTDDGTGAAARFTGPKGVAVDGSGNVYVADFTASTIRKITSAGVVTTLAGSPFQTGTADGTGSAAQFKFPWGVTVDGTGAVYVADSASNTIRKITPAGVVTTLAGSAGQTGSTDGTGSAARFNNPAEMGVDSAGNIYVSEIFNNTVRKITPAGVVTTLAGIAGTGFADGTGATARFNDPYSMAADSAGNVYVADSINSVIRKFTPAGVVTTFAGSALQTGTVDATGTAARFYYPSGVALDGTGALYVADTQNNTIRKITPAGVVTTFAGSPTQSGTADGTGSAARFNKPCDVVVDSTGNIFVTDTQNKTIRKITPAGVVTTLAGLPGQAGSNNGTGSAATFNQPYGLGIDSADNLFVADTNNGLIRKVTPGGAVTNFASNLDIPEDVTVDHLGNVYVTDTAHDAIVEYNPAGQSTAIGGSLFLSGTANGTGTAANFDYPGGIVVDSLGNVYVADTFNSTIRKGVPPAPLVNSASSTSGTGGAAFSYQITASNTPESFAATSLPAGLLINTATGLISGTATTGTYSASISAINVTGTNTTTLSIAISAPVPALPTIAMAILVLLLLTVAIRAQSGTRKQNNTQ